MCFRWRWRAVRAAGRWLALLSINSQCRCRIACVFGIPMVCLCSSQLRHMYDLCTQSAMSKASAPAGPPRMMCAAPASTYATCSMAPGAPRCAPAPTPTPIPSFPMVPPAAPLGGLQSDAGADQQNMQMQAEECAAPQPLLQGGWMSAP